MAVQYDHDWEDPRLAVEGFVTNYIVARLAREDLEWREAPDVPVGADNEHNAMRTMCEIFEERRQEELLELSKDLEDTNNLHFARYSEVVKEFSVNDTDIPNEMTYGRMVGLIAFAGLMCVERAKEGNRRDVGQIALYTSKIIDSGIRLTWIESMRSWANLMMDEYQARFMEMAVAVGMRRNGVSRRPNGVAPPPRPPTQSSSSSRPSRRSSLLFAVGSVAIVGSFVAYRALMKSH
ncbi:ced-9 [Pristionchus pacificus]|uniref:Apoptosis regulator ced-9 n=1 Tax=Pristionchus pacificus TaxID=54126 RepID=A0A2A6D3X5_PRIPA|nr:ced-9 [Pristionchus pacificus]|eukprot:PDM84937.1 ced-9 [Pristionchus pacificus]